MFTIRAILQSDSAKSDCLGNFTCGYNSLLYELYYLPNIEKV